MALHCSECGFTNAEGANYCARCGAYLAAAEAGEDPTTITYRIDDAGEVQPVDVDEEVAAAGAVLVIRSGGGHVGQTFALEGEKMTIGRRPESDIFLDDVTVSRDHAVIVRRGTEHFIDDAGSLNGTYLNRERADSQQLTEGDELQIGKFRLAYHER